VRLSINDLALVDGPPVEVDEPGRAARLIALGLRGGAVDELPALLALVDDPGRS
jgi:hypothetical protein